MSSELDHIADESAIQASDISTVTTEEQLVTPIAEEGESVVSHASEVIWIKREFLIPDPEQVRKSFPESHINSLRESILEDGLRHPLDVVALPTNEDDEQHYLIVDGECRYRASEGLLEELPCIVLSEETAKSWSLKANLLREDLNPMEKSDCLMRYMKATNLLDEEGKAERNSITMISGKYNISTSMVSELYSLQRLPAHIKEEQRKTGNIPLRKIKKLSTKEVLSNDELLNERYQQLLKQFTPKEPKKIEKRDPSQPNKIRMKHIEGVRSKAENTLEYYKQIDFSTYSVEESNELKKSLDDALLSIMELQEVIDQKIKELNTKIDFS